MVSSLTRNQVPGNRLRVRLPCPPLIKPCVPIGYTGLFSSAGYWPKEGKWAGAMRVLCPQDSSAGRIFGTVPPCGQLLCAMWTTMRDDYGGRRIHAQWGNVYRE